jgi:hypothetical protein
LLDLIQEIGSYAGLAAFFGLALLALLSFTHGRDIRRLREWAGSAPERDAERKESTSAIAAQRAEELRQLDESRTAERAAVGNRSERLRRREEGLPELSWRERLGERFSGDDAKLSSPLALVAVFVAFVVIAGGAAYLVLGGSDESGKSGKASAAMKAPAEIEVTVLNGTAEAGLAAEVGDRVERKGFRLGAVGNSTSSFEESVVMFKPGFAPEARRVAKQLQISQLQPITGEIESLAEGATVAVIVGEDNAETAG